MPQTYESQPLYNPPMSQAPVQEMPIRNKQKRNKPVQRTPKTIVLSSAHQAIKRDIEGIVESIVLTNSMIDAADPNQTDGLDLITELVGNIKVSDTQLLNIISSVDQSDLVDFAIKVNEDCQATMRRYKQLQRGQMPDQFIQTSLNNNFTNPPLEEAKFEDSQGGFLDYQDVPFSQPQRPKEKLKKPNKISEYDLANQLDWNNQAQNQNINQPREQRSKRCNPYSNQPPAFPQNDGGGLLDLEFPIDPQPQQNTRNQNQFQTYGMSNFGEPDLLGVQIPPKKKKKNQTEFPQNVIQTPQKPSGGIQGNFMGSLNEFQDDSLLSSPFGLGNSEIKPKKKPKKLKKKHNNISNGMIGQDNNLNGFGDIPFDSQNIAFNGAMGTPPQNQNRTQKNKLNQQLDFGIQRNMNDDPFGDINFGTDNNQSSLLGNTDPFGGDAFSNNLSGSKGNMNFNKNQNNIFGQNSTSQIRNNANNDFNFDDINLDFNDLNLNGTPAQKQPPTHQMMPNQNSNSGFSLGESIFGNSGMNNQSNSNNNLLDDFSASNTNNNMFNTCAPPNSQILNNQPNKIPQTDPFGNKRPGDFNAGLMNIGMSQPQMPPKQMGFNNSFPQQSNNDSFGGPFNTAIPQQRPFGMQQQPSQLNRGGMDSFNNMENNMSLVPFQQNSNTMGSQSMFPNSDPFSFADNPGYNMGGYNGGFNTMMQPKQKKKNPFSK